MKNVQVSFGLVVLVILAISAAGQAASSSLDVVMWGVGDLFEGGGPIEIEGLRNPPSGTNYHPYYWSGAYAEATVDGFTNIDDQTAPGGGPWPNVSTIEAQAFAGATSATGGTASGTAWFGVNAQLPPGLLLATGYGKAEHWIDFETPLLENKLAVGYMFVFDLQTGGLSEQASVKMYEWTALYQWADENSDGIRDDNEWDLLDAADFSFGQLVAGGDNASGEDAGEHSFDPFGPGVYRLGFGGWGWGRTRQLGPAPSPIPAPGALLLAGLGAGLVGRLRSRGLF